MFGSALRLGLVQLVIRSEFRGGTSQAIVNLLEKMQTSSLANTQNTNIGASVAKWLAHLPFTSEAAGSNLTRYFLDATRTQSSCEKSKSQRSAESRGFSPGTPVSSHRES